MSNPTVYFMTAAGAAFTSQIHLPDATTLLPILSATDANGSSNMFAVPVQFRTLMTEAGLESSALQSSLAQGPTSARPASPGDGVNFYDQTIRQLITWSALQGKWVPNATYRGYGT